MRMIKKVKSRVESDSLIPSEIIIKNVSYYKHPVYDQYAADMDGNVINIDRKVPMKGNKQVTGYLKVSVRGQNQNSQKSYFVHRFVYECIFGLIPDGLVIDHINENEEDDSLINLRLTTQQKNVQRPIKNGDYSFRKNRRSVKAINIETKQVFYFRSLYAAQQNLSVDRGIVSKCCRKEYGYKTGISKKNGQRYKFEFTTKVKISKC